MKRVLMGLAIAVVAVTGCSAQAAPVARSSPVLTTTPARNLADPAEAQLAYYEYIEGLTWVGPKPDREKLRVTGQAVCYTTGVPGVTMDTQTKSFTDDFDVVGKLGYGSRLASAVVRAAGTYLCPKARYAYVAAPTTVVATTTPAPPPAPAGPMTTFGEGTYVVGAGPDEIAPGTYVAPGSSGSPSCYWERLDADGDIIPGGNYFGDGQAVAPIGKKDGMFNSRDCGTWVKKK